MATSINNKQIIKVSLSFASLALVYYYGRQIYKTLKGNTKNKKENCDDNENVMVLFFPDSKVSCRTHFTERYGCKSPRCGFSHDPEAAYGKLLRCISSARLRLDLCVYMITCAELSDVIVTLLARGVKIRIITDLEMIEASGSAVGRFRKQGIEVRHQSSTYLMHHKFAVVDGSLLINGSFNWTRQAITGNHENLVISSNSQLVRQFSEEFERLWSLFDPRSKLTS